ncbi:MAG: MATE family efflux transporter [Firmicutes bacterium]|nr:MATE family efflux transporter [Bacillota bacterium]
MGKKRSFLTASGALFSARQLWTLLWPLVIEQLFSVLIGMIDVLMVSYIGEAAVSGVSLVDSVNHLILQVLFALTAGGTVVCAQYTGRKDPAAAGKSCGQLIMVTVLSMFCLTAVFLSGGKSLLALIFGSVEPRVMADAVIYMRYTAASFPFLALYHGLSAGFRAQGNTRVSMLVSMGMNVLNVLGNAFCIFVLGMGVAGVAIPTLLARAVGAAAMLLLFQQGKNEIRIGSFRQMKPEGTILRQMLSIGVPNSVESALFNVGKVALQSLVSTLGTASIAAYAVASNLATYLYLPGNALGAAMITVVAQCHGAGKPEQGKQYAKLLIALNYGMLAPICAALIIGRGFWVSCYHLSANAAALGAGLILAHAVAMLIWPVAFLLPYYFRAVGRAGFTMTVALFAMAVFRVGLAYVCVKLLGKNVLWIWYAMFADWLFRTVIYSDAFRREKRGAPQRPL